MGIVVDLIIVLIVGLCVFIGYKKGLTKCLLKLLTAFIAIIVAVVFYKSLADFVVQSTTIDENIQLSLEKVINTSKEESQEASNEEETDSTQTDNKEEKILISEDSGIPKPIINYLNNNVNQSVQSKKEEAISTVSRSATIIIVNIACFIIIYILTKIVLKIFVVLTDIVTRLPLIKQFNEIGGLLYGLIEGVFIIFIVMTVISVITPLTGAYEIANTILESHIGSFFYNNNIILNIIF